MKKQIFREPLTQEEKNEHRNNYENETPAVYVGTYGKYNAGSIYGMWVDLSTFDTEEDFLEFCYRLHADEADPELMYQDFECFPEAYYEESHIDFEAVQEWLEIPEDKREAFKAFCDYTTYTTYEEFEERYYGQFGSDAECAEHYYTESGQLGNVPDWVAAHIDWEGVWRCGLRFDMWEHNGYYFHQC